MLAVDPTSPFSGGALLGDRIRMSDHAADPGVFIRSMASRGHLGGLSWAAPQAMRVLDAAGCDVVLVETVGVGQSEVEVASTADTTVVLLAPGMGDGVQAAKAGILEVADVLVVNKADRDGADATVRDLRHAVSLGDRTEPGAWRPPVLRTEALTGERDRRARLRPGRPPHPPRGRGPARATHRAAAREVEALAVEALRRRLGGVAGTRLDTLAADVVAGRIDPYTAADALIGGAPVTPDLATKPTLEGELVVLRPFREGDVEVMAEILSDPEVRALTGSVETTAEAEQRARARRPAPRLVRHAQRPDRPARPRGRGPGHRPAGGRGRPQRGRPRRPHRQHARARRARGPGQGIGTEAVGLVTAQGLERLGLRRITLEVFDHNPRGRRVYEKVGYTATGQRADALVFDGLSVGATDMAVDAATWRGWPPRDA